MPSERDIQNEILRLQKLQGDKVTNICNMVSGDPFSPNDTGMKGILMGIEKDMKEFDISDFKANVKFREKKESETSRLVVGVTILIVNLMVSGFIGLMFTMAAKAAGTE